MTTRPSDTSNELGQPIGYGVPTWTDRRRPPRTVMEGRYARLEPLEPRRHGNDLFAAFAIDPTGGDWTYMAHGPFPTPQSLASWMQLNCLGEDPLFHAIVDKQTNKAMGLASFMRIDPKAGAIEVGSISLSPAMQGSQLSTEAQYLMARRVFDELGYRRYEWKCDALNARSRKAAERLGFTFEGIFRQALVYKGRNRDTAWYSMLDYDWPAIRSAMQAWLDPSNFDAVGQQRTSLSATIGGAVKRAELR
jgi:RimJ/RimL family protein N-acetyltransferase